MSAAPARPPRARIAAPASERERGGGDGGQSGRSGGGDDAGRGPALAEVAAGSEPRRPAARALVVEAPAEPVAAPALVVHGNDEEVRRSRRSPAPSRPSRRSRPRGAGRCSAARGRAQVASKPGPRSAKSRRSQELARRGPVAAALGGFATARVVAGGGGPRGGASAERWRRRGRGEGSGVGGADASGVGVAVRRAGRGVVDGGKGGRAAAARTCRPGRGCCRSIRKYQAATPTSSPSRRQGTTGPAAPSPVRARRAEETSRPPKANGRRPRRPGRGSCVRGARAGAVRASGTRSGAHRGGGIEQGVERGQVLAGRAGATLPGRGPSKPSALAPTRPG